MNKVNLFITEANHNLSAYKDMIEESVKIAEEYAFPKLKIDWDIDMIACFVPKSVSENSDCVSGHTYEKNLIVLNIEEEFKEYEISEVLVHELCHAVRWEKNDEWINNLFDLLIFEGLAVNFAADFIKNHKKCQNYMSVILNRADSDNEKIYDLTKNRLDGNNYDYEKIFIGDGDKMPYWAGYSLGYYLVKNILRKPVNRSKMPLPINIKI